MRAEGRSYRAIAEELADRGVPTRNGGPNWTHPAVASVLKRTAAWVAARTARRGHTVLSPISALLSAAIAAPTDRCPHCNVASPNSGFADFRAGAYHSLGLKALRGDLGCGEVGTVSAFVIDARYRHLPATGLPTPT